MAADDPSSNEIHDASLLVKVVAGIAVSISTIAAGGMVNMYGTLSALQERVTHRGFAIASNRDGLHGVVADLKSSTDDRYRRRDADRDLGKVWVSIREHDGRLDKLERECLPAVLRAYPDKGAKSGH